MGIVTKRPRNFVVELITPGVPVSLTEQIADTRVRSKQILIQASCENVGTIYLGEEDAGSDGIELEPGDAAYIPDEEWLLLDDYFIDGTDAGDKVKVQYQRETVV